MYVTWDGDDDWCVQFIRWRLFIFLLLLVVVLILIFNLFADLYVSIYEHVSNVWLLFMLLCLFLFIDFNGLFFIDLLLLWTFIIVVLLDLLGDSFFISLVSFYLTFIILIIYL